MVSSTNTMMQLEEGEILSDADSPSIAVAEPSIVNEPSKQTEMKGDFMQKFVCYGNNNSWCGHQYPKEQSWESLNPSHSSNDWDSLLSVRQYPDADSKIADRKRMSRDYRLHGSANSHHKSPERFPMPVFYSYRTQPYKSQRYRPENHNVSVGPSPSRSQKRKKRRQKHRLINPDTSLKEPVLAKPESIGEMLLEKNMLESVTELQMVDMAEAEANSPSTIEVLDDDEEDLVALREMALMSVNTKNVNKPQSLDVAHDKSPELEILPSPPQEAVELQQETIADVDMDISDQENSEQNANEVFPILPIIGAMPQEMDPSCHVQGDSTLLIDLTEGEALNLPVPNASYMNDVSKGVPDVSFTVPPSLARRRKKKLRLRQKRSRKRREQRAEEEAIEKFLEDFKIEEALGNSGNQEKVNDVSINHPSDNIQNENLTEQPEVQIAEESPSDPVQDEGSTEVPVPSDPICIDEDEDLLRARLLIDLEKRSQSSRAKSTDVALPLKTTVASQCAFIRSAQDLEPVPYNEIEPIVISLQSDSSDEEDSSGQEIGGTCSQPDSADPISDFIQRIRNSTSTETPVKNAGQLTSPSKDCTPKALSFLSKAKQNMYRQLKASIRQKKLEIARRKTKPSQAVEPNQSSPSRPTTVVTNHQTQHTGHNEIELPEEFDVEATTGSPNPTTDVIIPPQADKNFPEIIPSENSTDNNVQVKKSSGSSGASSIGSSISAGKSTISDQSEDCPQMEKVNEEEPEAPQTSQKVNVITSVEAVENGLLQKIVGAPIKSKQTDDNFWKNVKSQYSLKSQKVRMMEDLLSQKLSGIDECFKEQRRIAEDIQRTKMKLKSLEESSVKNNAQLKAKVKAAGKFKTDIAHSKTWLEEMAKLAQDNGVQVDVDDKSEKPTRSTNSLKQNGNLVNSNISTAPLATSHVKKIVGKRSSTMKNIPPKRFKLDNRTKTQNAPTEKPITQTTPDDEDSDVLCIHSLLGKCNTKDCPYLHTSPQSPEPPNPSNNPPNLTQT